MKVRSRRSRFALSSVLVALGLAASMTAVADDRAASGPPGDGSAPRPRLVAVRSTSAPDIDGDLGDAAWAQVTPTTAFTQKFPDEGKGPSEPTRLRVLYDDHNLYVGFDCSQGVAIKGRLARRDRQVESDWVQVAVDDGNNTYEFSVNAAGVLGDGVRFNDTDYSADWNGVWDAQTKQSATGWTAELRIPLRIFHGSDGVQDWGFQARRYISERQETVEWSFIPRAMAGEVSHYGRLGGIVGVSRSNPVELLPYVTVGGNVGNVAQRDRSLDYDANAGLDVSWRLGRSLTLDATVNPDFAQVEADQVLLNLSTFETFAPEKRPFFINGMEIFQLPKMASFQGVQTMFYTRRIGAVPELPVLTAADPAGATAQVVAPGPATIYGAAKLSGQVGGGVGVGLMSALTAREDVTVRPPVGAAVSRLAAPMALENVGRVRVPLGAGAAIGVLATAVNRFEPGDGYPTVMAPTGSQTQLCPDGSSVAVGARCFHDAYAGGLDASWRSPSGTYVAAGQGLLTAVEHGPARTMLDGTVIASGDVDSDARLYLAKEGGQLLASVEMERIGRRVDFNDLGFLQRQNQLRIVPYLEYRTLTPFWEIAQLSGHAFTSLRDNLDGLDLLHGYYLGGDARFKNFWSVAAEGYAYTSRYDDREIGDGTALQRPNQLGGDVSFSTDPRRQLAGSAATETAVYSTGKSFTLDGAVTYQPLQLPRLEVQLLPQLVYSSGDPRYVSGTRQSGSYLFGNLKARSVGATLRTSYTFTNRLTLQVYGQLLLVAKHYSKFASYEAGAGVDKPVIKLDQLMPTAAPADNPDSAETSLNINAVLRWEFRPGSTLFVVYSRYQAPELALGGEDAKLDLGALRHGPSTDSIRIKLSYYWN
jgi:Domain of unknown function (DUF5916)/Carbohydrate family 9 binding domain-like